MTIKDPVSSDQPTAYSSSYSTPIEYPTSTFSTSTTSAPVTTTTYVDPPPPTPTPPPPTPTPDGLFNPSTVNPLVNEENHHLKGNWEMTSTKHTKGFFKLQKATLKSEQIGQSYYEDRWEMSGKWCWCCPWSDTTITKSIPTSDTTYDIFTTFGSSSSPWPAKGTMSDGPAGKKLHAKGTTEYDGGSSTVEFQGKNKFSLEMTVPGEAYAFGCVMERKI